MEKIERTFGMHPDMTAGNSRDGGLGAQALFACGLVICALTGCRKEETGSRSQVEQVAALTRQEAQNPPTALKQEVRLPPAIAAEILGRWKIVRYDFCGIIAMGPEEADWYIGKTVLIEPGRMVFNDYPKNNVSEEIICRFTNMSFRVEHTEDFLASWTGCAPGHEDFVKIKEKKLKVFDIEEGCADTPFGGFFKPNFNTMVITWNRILFFMERDASRAGDTGKTAERTARMLQ